MFFPFERAAEVLHAWTELVPTLPDELMTWASLLQFPDTPDVPEPVRGGSFTVVYGAFLGSEGEGRALLRPIRDLGPAMDTFAMVPPAALGDMAMDPPDPLPIVSATALLSDLPSAGVDDLVAAVGPGPGHRWRWCSCASSAAPSARRSPGAGARATLPGTLSLFALGVPEDEASAATARATSMPSSAPSCPTAAAHYPNFVEEPADASGFFDADTWARLREVKALYDPSDLFKGNHHVPGLWIGCAGCRLRTRRRRSPPLRAR